VLMHIISAVKSLGDENMPNMDRTGPLGKGPHGRGMGPCRSGGQNFRMGGGRGMGRGRGFPAMTGSGTDLSNDLGAEVQALEARLKILKERLADEGKGSP